MCKGFDMGPMVYTTYLFQGCTRREKKFQFVLFTILLNVFAMNKSRCISYLSVF